MFKKLLTIVVPVYNVEKYINKCLDSLVLDDPEFMKKLEVIIVNDGTPDRSAELSREYVKRYPETFRQIDKENGGHGSAWNVGLKAASGRYVRFLDSDDWLTDLDKLMVCVQESDADLFFSSVEYVYDDNSEENKVYGAVGQKNRKSDISDFEFYQNRFDIANFWFATYKREVLLGADIRFLEHCFYDDAILTAAPYFCSKSFLILDFVVYHWRLGRSGQTSDSAVIRCHADDRIRNHRHLVGSYSDFAGRNNLSETVTKGIGICDRIITML